MRILHVVTRSHLRGAELSALDLAEELRALGHENTVVALAPAFDGSTEASLPVLDPSPSLGLRAAVRHARAVRGLIREQEPDIILAHGGTAARACASLPRRWRPPVVWQRILQFPEHTMSGQRSLPWRLLSRRLDGAIALTPRTATELEMLGFPGPVWRIPNSRRASRFSELDRTDASAKLRLEVGVADEVPLVGLVGHLVEQKRPERAIAVLGELGRSGVAAHLVVVGDGPLRQQLAATVDRAGLGEHVTLLGERRDIPELLVGLDLLLATSDAEGLPGVMIEACMAGCPVVTFPFDGADDVADSCVVVLEEPSIPAMAEVVADLLGDEDRRSELAERGRSAVARLSTERTAHHYASCLAEVVARAGRPGTGLTG